MQIVPESDAFLQGLFEKLLFQADVVLGEAPHVALAGELLGLGDRGLSQTGKGAGLSANGVERSVDFPLLPALKGLADDEDHRQRDCRAG